MSSIDFDKVKQNVIDDGIAISKMEDVGLVLTNTELCGYNSEVILMHMRNIYDELDKEQVEKVNGMYNVLIH